MYNPIISTTGNFNSGSWSMYQNSLIKVNGIDSARAYPMLPNSTVVLFDSNDDVFYLKSTDATGFQTIRVFKFAEVKEDTPSNQFVTIDEFNKFKEEVLNGQQHIRKQYDKHKNTKQHSANKVNDGDSEDVF